MLTQILVKTAGGYIPGTDKARNAQRHLVMRHHNPVVVDIEDVASDPDPGSVDHRGRQNPSDDSCRCFCLQDNGSRNLLLLPCCMHRMHVHCWARCILVEEREPEECNLFGLKEKRCPFCISPETNVAIVECHGYLLGWINRAYDETSRFQTKRVRIAFAKMIRRIFDPLPLPEESENQGQDVIVLD